MIFEKKNWNGSHSMFKLVTLIIPELSSLFHSIFLADFVILAQILS